MVCVCGCSSTLFFHSGVCLEKLIKKERRGDRQDWREFGKKSTTVSTEEGTTAKEEEDESCLRNRNISKNSF